MPLNKETKFLAYKTLVGQTRFFSLGEATSLGEGKL